MKILIHGAQTLDKFTKELLLGFDSAEGIDYSFEIFQIHASPNSLDEDKAILAQFSNCKTPKVILIHRPDELLLHLDLKYFFETHQKINLIFLGDLAFKDSFWKSREEFITVIPHFYSSLNMPERSEAFTIGTFTSWGEMRKLDHFESLVQAIKKHKTHQKIHFKIGGSLNGVALTQEDVKEREIEITEESFIPHFNVQLYHLNDKKRFAESSGSLHAGISIPVIFEANGMERIEEVKVIKIEASDDLKEIAYDKAAKLILSMIDQNEVEKALSHNLKKARLNTSVDFANQAISMTLR